MANPKVLVIVGPTASGKTNLARFLASQFNGELVSADSRQVYVGLDIGTGKEGELKPNTAPGTNLASVYPRLRYLDDIPQWLIDIADPRNTFTAADFQQRAYEVIDDIIARGKLPIIVGGTGLYISALLKGYVFDRNIPRDENNPRHAAGNYLESQPPAWDVLEIGIDLPRDELYRRIDLRVDSRIEEGMIKEGRRLVAEGLSYDRLRHFGLEYKFLADLLQGNCTEAEFAQKLKYAIHGFARRQLTWFRHHGDVVWVKDKEEAARLLK